MAVDTQEKRMNAARVGRPWTRARLAVGATDQQSRIASGNGYGGNALSEVAVGAGIIQVAFVGRQIGVTFTGAISVTKIPRLPLACEKSTYEVEVTFTDEDDAALTPDTLVWDLRTIAGTVINSREDVVATPAATVSIVLQGDDLAIIDSEDNRLRRVTLSGTYTSDNGSGLPFNVESEFQIADLVGVS